MNAKKIKKLNKPNLFVSIFRFFIPKDFKGELAKGKQIGKAVAKRKLEERDIKQVGKRYRKSQKAAIKATTKREKKKIMRFGTFVSLLSALATTIMAIVSGNYIAFVIVGLFLCVAVANEKKWL